MTPEETAREIIIAVDVRIGAFAWEELRQSVIAAIRDAYERAAEMVEESHDIGYIGRKDIADRIRALKGEQ